MSHVRHEAVCITSWNGDKLLKLREKVLDITENVTPIFKSGINGYETFFVFPCGSKAGWPKSMQHLRDIMMIKEAIDSFAYEDGSTSIQYHVAIYGEFEG